MCQKARVLCNLKEEVWGFEAKNSLHRVNIFSVKSQASSVRCEVLNINQILSKRLNLGS